MPPYVFWTLIASLLLLVGVWFYLRSRFSHHPSCSQAAHCSLSPRHLKPRSPLDCPACCSAALSAAGKEPSHAPVRPWREVKSRRGAPKRANTEGVACPNQACPYYGISAVQVHAVVSDGSSGKVERIQRWRCQACQTTFSARLHTPMYQLKTPAHRVALVLSALAEGLDVSAAERVFGVRHATITRWLLRAGSHAQRLQQRSFTQLEI